MKKYSLLISSVLLILLGISFAVLWTISHNVIIGLLAGLAIIGVYILVKAWKTGIKLLPVRKDEKVEDEKKPNTFTFYGVYNKVTGKERGDRLEVEYVEHPEGRAQPVTNLGNRKFYFRRNIPSHNGDTENEKFEPVTLPDCKYMPPGLFLYPLRMPSYTKYMKYIKAETNVVSVGILAAVIGVEILGLVIIP